MKVFFNEYFYNIYIIIYTYIYIIYKDNIYIYIKIMCYIFMKNEKKNIIGNLLLFLI